MAFLNVIDSPKVFIDAGNSASYKHCFLDPFPVNDWISISDFYSYNYVASKFSDKPRAGHILTIAIITGAVGNFVEK